MVGVKMILKRYPGLFNIFADSNQHLVEHFTPAGGSSERDFSSHFFATGGCPLQSYCITYIYNCNRQNL